MYVRNGTISLQAGENVRSNGWSRLDALALLCHVASQRATDGDVSLTVSSHAASAETVATLAWKEGGVGVCGKYTLSGHDDIAISVTNGERNLLAQMALISGGASAYRFDNEGKVFHQFDVSGIEKQPIPSLDVMRSKVIAASMPTKDLMILLPKGEGAQATEMLSEVIKSLSTVDCGFVQSQKCNEKNAHTRTPSLDR